MATYIQQILDRADIQVLRDLLINAVADRSYVDSRTYEQRVQEGDASVNRYLERTYPDGAARDAVFVEIADAIMAHENVFFEVGMKCGARLLYQLLYERQPSDL